MIDWNKRNGGFLAPECVYEDQLSNLSMQINQLEKQIDKQKEVLDKIKEYAGELRLFDNESVEFEISNNILEILEEIE